MTTTFLLGAGFSRAISAQMPLMTDLGPVVAAALEGRQLPAARPRPQDNIEVWLSYTLEDQPFLTAEQNLLNRAAAQTAIEALRDEVVKRQGAAEKEEIPAWLNDLVTIWHGLRSEVITLNWDTLVEDTVESLDLWSLSYPTFPGDTTPISSDDVLNRVPRLAQGSPSGGPPGRVTFRLWKLHGSIDWYWSEGDPHGETVVRRPYSRPAVGDTAGIGGKVAFFAAPTASKVIHYQNQIIRHIWRGARHAFENSETIVLIGCSLPVTDLTVRALLAGTNASQFTIVDPSGDEVIPSLRNVVGEEIRVQRFDSLEEFSSTYATKFAKTRAKQLIQEWAGELTDPVLASVSNKHYGPISAVQETDEDLQLTASVWRDSLNQGTGMEVPEGMSVEELKKRIEGDLPLYVQGPEGDRHLIYDVTLLRRDIGRSNTWMQLRCQA